MADRNIVKASLPPRAKKRFNETAEHLGMKQQACLGRLIDWFARQDELTQIWVMGLVPEDDSLMFLSMMHEKELARREGREPELARPVAELVENAAQVLRGQRAPKKPEAKSGRRRSASG